MSSQHADDSHDRVPALIWGLVALAWVLGIGVAAQQKTAPAQPIAPLATSPRPALALPVMAPVLAPALNDPDTDRASVVVQHGLVKFYFAPNQSALATGGRDALTQIVRAVAEGKKTVVTGFHDSTGNAARNAQLARQRAHAVRLALNALGVSDAQIELKKPQQMPTNGNDAEARRVEITVQ